MFIKRGPKKWLSLFKKIKKIMSKVNKKIIIILHNKKLLQIDKYKMELDKFKKMDIDLEIHELINIINKSYEKSFE